MTCADEVRWNPLRHQGVVGLAQLGRTAPRVLDGPDRRRLPCLTKDASMRRACTLVAMIWMSGVSAACAQASSTTGMGATSPLGTSLSEPSSGASMADIPLAATELAQPGTSPLIMQCQNTSSNSSFDGGGMSASTGCSSAGTSTSSETASATSSGAGAGSMVESTANAGIPLGATGLGTPGESQNISVPNLSVAPCTQTQGAGNPAGSTGVISSGGC